MADFYYVNTTSTSVPSYTWSAAPVYVPRDISFDPSPAKPARPKTDMDWLREQVDSVCALAKA